MRQYCDAVGRPFPIDANGWTAAVSFAFFRVSPLPSPSHRCPLPILRLELTGERCDAFVPQLAVITQGIASRFARGQASSAQAGTYSKLFPVIGRLAVDTIRREEEAVAKL